MNATKRENYPRFLFAVAGAILFGVAVATGYGQPTAPKPRAAVTAGQQAPPFQAKTIDGQTIHFPDDYKDKVVMLDFWATWCGPCRAELPNVLAAYHKYHTNGLEIVSVSLDLPQHGPAVQEFVHDLNMTWPQIYDGGYWKAAIAVQYGVRAIPCPVVVDGDTGKILAVGTEAVGRRLPQVLGRALAAKNSK